MQEIWKPLIDYPGYFVSSLGRIKSVKSRNGSHEKILHPGKTKKGYLYVTLSNDGKTKTFSVHRLVAIAFIANPLNLPQINHINENKTDNRVSNLEWCTNKYNMNYGSRTHKQIITRSIPVICVETGQVYLSATEASRSNPPIRQGNITLCCQGKNNTAGGFHWQYYLRNQ